MLLVWRVSRELRGLAHVSGFGARGGIGVSDYIQEDNVSCVQGNGDNNELLLDLMSLGRCFETDIPSYAVYLSIGRRGRYGHPHTHSSKPISFFYFFFFFF